MLIVTLGGGDARSSQYDSCLKDAYICCAPSRSKVHLRPPRRRSTIMLLPNHSRRSSSKPNPYHHNHTQKKSAKCKQPLSMINAMTHVGLSISMCMNVLAQMPIRYLHPLGPDFDNCGHTTTCRCNSTMRILRILEAFPWKLSYQLL